MEARPLGRTLELGDIPRPDLVGLNSQQLGLGVGGMDALIAPLTAGAVGAQHAVHGAHRAQVDTLVEQRGMHARRSGIGEALAV